MFPCRAAWQRCGPLARLAASRPPHGAVQRRSMSSVPGGSGENLVYALLCGGALAGAVSYAYSTVSTDHSRFNERILELQSRPKTEWSPKPWPPKGKDEDEGGDEDTGGEAETVVEEAAEVVEDVAEAVAEAAEEVAEVAHEVEAAAEEVAQAAQAIAPPAGEESDGNVPLAAASTLEVQKMAPLVEEPPSKPDLIPVGDEPEQATAPADSIALASGPVTKEDVAPVEAVTVAEEVPAPVAEEAPTPVAEEAPAPVVEEPVAEEAPAPVVEEPLAEEALAPVVEEAVAEEPVVEPPEPVVEVLSPAERDAISASAEEPDTTAVVVVSTLPADSPPAGVATPTREMPTEDTSTEYIVVVLEGTPKEEKRPKVLGVGPVTGRMIPAPEDDDAPASEGRRRVLRMQMQ